MLSFDERYTIDKPQLPQPNMEKPTFFNLHSPDGTSRYFTADKGTRFNAWLASEVPPSSSAPNKRSLGMTITSTDDLNTKDKILFSVVPHNGPAHIDTQDPGSTHNISFDMMLDKGYQVPKYWALHLQVWQCCGGHPPFTIGVVPGAVPNGPVNLKFNIADDVIDSNTNGQGQELARIETQRGRWMHITLNLDPQPDGASRAGHAKGWLDCKPLFSYDGNWGYVPSKDNAHAIAAHAEFTTRFGIDLGIYRRRNPTTQTVYFDNISYGPSGSGDPRCERR